MICSSGVQHLSAQGASTSFPLHTPATQGSILASAAKVAIDNSIKRRRRISLSKDDIESVLTMNQQEAAVKLKVSVSTLKRRYYELFGATRWPYRYKTEVLSAREAERTSSASPTLSYSSSSSTSSSPSISPSSFEPLYSISSQNTAALPPLIKFLHSMNVHGSGITKQNKTTRAASERNGKALVSYIIHSNNANSEKAMDERTLAFLSEAFGCSL